MLRDNGYGLFVTFRKFQRGDLKIGQIDALGTRMSQLKQKEHTQGKCHEKGERVDNTDIALGAGAHL